MELVVFLPVIFALEWSIKLLRAPADRPQTPGRLVGSFTLLMLVFGCGNCSAGVVVYMNAVRPAHANWQGAVICSLALLAVLTAFYLVRIRRLPRAEQGPASVSPSRDPRHAATIDVLVLAFVVAVVVIAAAIAMNGTERGR